MRLLLDENLDWRLRRLPPGHAVESVPLRLNQCHMDARGGLSESIQNGELLSKAIAAGFDVLVTMDGNMVHQQNIGRQAIAISWARMED